MPDLSFAQELSYAIALVVSGSLSIFGSFVLIRIVLNRRLVQDLPQRGGNNSNSTESTYQTLMLELSLCDVGVSIAFISQSVLLPPGGPSAPSFAVGTTASCTFLGYFGSVFFLSTAICNFCLAWYFFLVVKKSWRRSSDFACRSKFWSALIFILPQAIGIAGVLSESYNPLPYAPTCWLCKYEYGCDDDPNDASVYNASSFVEDEEKGQCIRRGNAITNYLRVSIMVAIMAMSLGAMYFTVQVLHSYRHRVFRSRRHVFESRSMSFSTPSTRFTTTPITTRNDDYLRQATVQAVCYLCVFLNQFIWVLGGFLVGQLTDGVYLFSLMGYIMCPLNGLFNAMIFLRPSYTKLRGKYGSNLTRFMVVRYVIADTPEETIIAHLDLRTSNNNSNEQMDDCSNESKRGTNDDIQFSEILSVATAAAKEERSDDDDPSQRGKMEFGKKDSKPIRSPTGSVEAESLPDQGDSHSSGSSDFRGEVFVGHIIPRADDSPCPTPAPEDDDEPATPAPTAPPTLAPTPAAPTLMPTQPPTPVPRQPPISSGKT